MWVERLDGGVDEVEIASALMEGLLWGTRLMRTELRDEAGATVNEVRHELVEPDCWWPLPFRIFTGRANPYTETRLWA
ncbi:hypothetical protein J1614_000114 [Plenodomus biglobosus]|nr:hypothetical protein J1614_000114 [Plenodomus biglobosus]